LSAGPALVGIPWAALGGAGSGIRAGTAESALRVTGMEVFEVTATRRTRWTFVRLRTNDGLTGLGEGSLSRGNNPPPFDRFFPLVSGESPFAIARYRELGRQLASSGDLSMATAFSAIEQALWDLVGKALGAPVYDLLGGKLRNELPVYANINRKTADRSPQGFASNAARAVEQGFSAIKAAPFDGFPELDAPAEDVERATESGIACIEAMRAAIGPDVELKIDCHSHFDVELAVSVARRLEPQALSWYEEPVAPERIAATRAIATAIDQRLAGGEVLFGMERFAPLCRERAVDVVMPDVKHCGGILEGRKIATVAELHGVLVSPHNPSGPVGTAASVQLCAGVTNFESLEYQWNEVDWRGELVEPPERILGGTISVPVEPGLGVALNEKLVLEHS
jgi:galactonate dehydratase